MMQKRFVLVIATGALFLAAFAQNARAHDEPVMGSLVGAGIGAAIGGPPGAAVGAVIGAAVGSHAAHQGDHGRRAHRPVRHGRRDEARAQPVGYARPAEYARPARSAVYKGNGNSWTNCPAHKRIAYVEKPRPAAVTKVKRVCRYVPVREVVAAR